MLVQDESLPKEALDLLELVMASSSLLLVLINNLLDVRKCSANSKCSFHCDFSVSEMRASLIVPVL